MLNNLLDAPATKRQLATLFQVSKGDANIAYRYTVGQADFLIAVYQDRAIASGSDIDIGVKTSPLPFTEARVTLIEGAQGSGKNTTAVARVVDAYDKDCVAIYCREILKINCKIIGYYRSHRVAKIKQDGVMKLIKIPPAYKLHSPIRIFSNFHLFGLPYAYCQSYHQIVARLKKDVIRDGFLLLDEHYIGGNAREGMKAISRELVKQSFQFRKMRLQVMVITPMARLIDWTTRTIPTEHISCSCDNNRGKITLDIKKKGQKGTKQVTFDGSVYWGNFFTEERINQ